MAVILAVETATRTCSVAVGVDGRCVALREETSERLSHAEKVNIFAAEVLAEAGFDMDKVDAFAVGIGPGSFTGLRIGVSAAKGWAFALDKPLIALTTLHILVEAVMANMEINVDEIWPMVDARRMEVFTQPFDATGKMLGSNAPLILNEEWVAATDRSRLVAGDGADKAADLWAGKPGITHMPGIIPSAQYMFRLAQARYAAGEFDDLAYLVPDYGKGANVTKAKGLQ